MNTFQYMLGKKLLQIAFFLFHLSSLLLSPWSVFCHQKCNQPCLLGWAAFGYYWIYFWSMDRREFNRSRSQIDPIYVDPMKSPPYYCFALSWKGLPDSKNLSRRLLKGGRYIREFGGIKVGTRFAMGIPNGLSFPSLIDLIRYQLTNTAAAATAMHGRWISCFFLFVMGGVCYDLGYYLHKVWYFFGVLNNQCNIYCLLSDSIARLLPSKLSF